MHKFIFCLTVIYTTSWGQVSPIVIKPTIHVPVLGGAAIGLGAGLLLSHRTNPLTSDQLISLDKNAIPFWDRGATHQYNTNFRKTSDILLYASIATPSLLMLSPSMRKDAGKIAFVSVETFALNVLLNSLTKFTVLRTRPFVYNMDSAVPYHEKLNKDARYSFYSGHTSTSAAMCFSSAQLFNLYNPTSKLRPWVWASAAIIPAITGFSRYKAGKHFPTDIITGYLIGAGIGFFVPKLFFHK